MRRRKPDSNLRRESTDTTGDACESGATGQDFIFPRVPGMARAVLAPNTPPIDITCGIPLALELTVNSSSCRPLITTAPNTTTGRRLIKRSQRVENFGHMDHHPGVTAEKRCT